MKFNPDQDIPDLAGRIVVVTGGTDGLGKESVLQLAKHNPQKIYLAARSHSKAEKAIDEIKTTVGSTCAPIEFLALDLSSLASVRSAAKALVTAESRLDILLCNAGIMGNTSSSPTTKEGYEPMFGVNHMGHSLFVLLLQPVLQSTAKLPGVAPGDTRVVILASGAEMWASKSNTESGYPLDELKSPMKKTGNMAKYGISKLANVHATRALADKFPEQDTGVRFVSVHPGGVYTNLGSGALGSWKRTETLVKKAVGVLIGMVSVEEGAKGQLWACTWPAARDKAPKNGEFYHPIAVEGKGSKRSTNIEKARQLWAWTEKELEAWLK